MDPIGTLTSFIGQVVDNLRNTPGGFGILIIPIGLLCLLAFAVSRNR